MILTWEQYSVLFSAAFLGSATTWVNRQLAVKMGLVAHPNPIIPQHTYPVAHLGGVGIGLVTTVVLVTFVLLQSQQVLAAGSASVPCLPLGIVSFGFLLLGAVDDIKPFSPHTKLLFQSLLAVAAAVIGLVYPWTGWSPIDFALSAFWIITLVNAVNVTDVCDGFVSGITAILLLFWGHFDPSHAMVAMAVSGACFGFLVFNFPPASIFLGDVGSHFLGFVLAFLMLSSPVDGKQEFWLRPVQILLMSGIFLFEAILLIVVRNRKGIPWYRGSPDHISLRMQLAGLSRLQTDLIAWYATILLCVAAMLLEYVTRSGQIVILSSVAIAIGVCWKFAQRMEGSPV